MPVDFILSEFILERIFEESAENREIDSSIIYLIFIKVRCEDNKFKTRSLIQKGEEGT